MIVVAVPSGVVTTTVDPTAIVESERKVSVLTVATPATPVTPIAVEALTGI